MISWRCCCLAAFVWSWPWLPGEAADFRKDVAPILARSCVKCHTGPRAKGGLRIETREQLLAGGDSGPVVVAGRPDESYLMDLVGGTSQDLVMPAQGPRLTAAQVTILREWIAGGLSWEAGFRFASSNAVPLAARRPALPAAAGPEASENPIDLLLQGYFHEHQVAATELVSDRLFARRVYLDLNGLLPPPAVLEEFVRDVRPDKRTLLVERLLDDRAAYADHWLTFWNDVLRNAYRGTGFIDGGRSQISGWLYQSLYESKPYDRFVHELISPVPGSEGFTKGIVWRGVVNASQRPEMQAAQNVAQVFMGTNLKCASCHDSFVNDWKLSESYSLAAVFADGDLEIHRCNKPTGELAKAGFIYSELGSIDAGLPRLERMKQLADLVTSPRNGRLGRAIVNRLWAATMGRGIIEPVDDLDQFAWHQDLLDWLAADFQDHGYDLKHTLRLICTSRAYQLPAVGAPRPDQQEFVFQGPLVRRMTAEQFVDAVATLTHVWPAKAVFQPPRAAPMPAGKEIAGKETAGKEPARQIEVDPRWIWDHAQAATADDGGRVFFRHDFILTELPSAAAAAVTCDNELVLYVNGKRIAASQNWGAPVSVDVTDLLVRGRNVIGVEAINYPDPETKKGLQFKGANPAGMILAAALRFEDGTWQSIVSNQEWICRDQLVPGWSSPAFDSKAWQHARELGNAKIAPWSIGDRLVESLRGQLDAAAGQSVGIRTALVNDDTLTRTLGRPNREQVVTRRDTLATTLQALELTNGDTLDGVLAKGARQWLRQAKGSAATLVPELYLQALGRRPTEAEMGIAQQLMATEPDEAALQDVLWILTMLPEFQLIY